MSFFPKSTQSIFVLLITILTIGASLFFEGRNFTESFLLSTFFFVVFPIACILFVFKTSLREYGFWGSVTQKSLLLFLGMLGIGLCVFFLLFFLFSLDSKTTPPQNDYASFWIFFVHFFLVYGFFSFAYEFFFRGFLQLGLQKELGFLAIFWQWGVFLIFLFLTDTFQWESADLIIASLCSGILLYNTRSFLLSFIFSWLFAILTTLLYIA